MRTITILGVVVFVLVLVAAGTGVVYAPPAAPIQYLTPRGEHATLQGSGLYRYDPVSVARERSTSGAARSSSRLRRVCGSRNIVPPVV